jgi:uncharacterized protein (TIGR02453 family)
MGQYVNDIPHQPHLSRELAGFLNELSDNNNKDWFDAHRSLYQSAWVEPTLEFIAAMAGPLGKFGPPLMAAPKVNGSLRRINRDVRFSRDKRPYSTRLHLVFWAGAHPNKAPGIHMVVAPGHWGFGAGHWAFEPAQLEAYRKAVTSRDGAKSLTAALARAAAVGCVADEPQLARVPKGFDAEEPVATMLRRKGVVVKSHDLPMADELFGPKAVDFALQRFKALMPLVGWLDRHVFV